MGYAEIMIDEALFRQVMGHFASGVTVVTTAHGGRLGGITVSSFASLSLQPMLVLVCIDHGAGSRGAIAEAGQFAVNILADTQEYLSRRFASAEAEKFIPGTYELSPRGLPLLNGALAHIECRLHSALPGGDHTIFVGEVVAAKCNDGCPLLYYRSGYHRLGT
ncbi:MAG TPA: flavin reductase family protein [Chloroflexaceae bacterium]|nr:flavin reductase family protein [Chloroflexaceae bacterium]